MPVTHLQKRHLLTRIATANKVHAARLRAVRCRTTRYPAHVIELMEETKRLEARVSAIEDQLHDYHEEIRSRDLEIVSLAARELEETLLFKEADAALLQIQQYEQLVNNIH